MVAYLVKNPPRRSQFRRPRRARPSGLIVVHTAESVMDTVGPDTGAENVANFIRNRTDPGSYHVLADSDSWIHLVPFDAEAYGDGTGSNPYAIHVSFACRTTDWSRMSASRRAAFIAQGAKGTAAAIRWLRSNGYPMPPLRQITRAQSSSKVPGFISHAQRDPGRRSDPGANFPWSEFFNAIAKEMTPVKKQRPAAIRQAISQNRAARDGLVRYRKTLGKKQTVLRLRVTRTIRRHRKNLRTLRKVKPR